MAVATEDPTQSAPARPHANRGRLSLAWVLLALLAGGAGSFVWQGRQLTASDELVSARVGHVTALVDLGTACASARELLAASEGRVDDDEVRDALADALASASATTRAAAATVHELDAAAAQVAQARDEVVAASADVRSAVRRWELGRARDGYLAAASALDDALATAGASLEASSGRVADEAVRTALADAIAHARSHRDSAVPDDVAALTARAAALGDAADSLAARQSDVDAAVATWEASRAAEAAAREAAEREAAKGGAAAEARPPRGARASGPSGGSSDGGHWEETVTYDDSFSVCGDTEGNAWFC